MYRQNPNSSGCRMFALFLIFWMATVAAFAQSAVKGVVKDEKGETMTGVSVTVKGAKGGTITGLDGSFTLNIGSKSAVLVFSFIGYERVEKTATAGKDVVVVMKEDNKL